MADFLDALRDFDPRQPSVRKWNALLDAVERRTVSLRGAFGGGQSEEFIHPFKVVTGRWDDMPDGVLFPESRTWRIGIAPGTVNDELVAITYRRVGDERGWEMPEGYPAPQPGEPGYGADFVDRALLDTEEEPPFLVIVTPTRGVLGDDSPGGFAAVPDGSRPLFFQTEEMWEKHLFRANVVLTADPGQARFYLPSVPVALKRFRCYVGALPGRGPAQTGGWLPIARLWMTRDESGDPESDEVYVQQLVFWCVGTGIALDTFTYPDPIVLPEFTDLAQSAIDETLASAALVFFWTQ